MENTKASTRNPFARKISFDLGQVVQTEGIRRLLDPEQILSAITRHARGDWGEVSDSDWNENELALQAGYRILSTYTIKDTTVWVVTTADRSSTTALLPDEY